jgi:TonB family protein
MSNPSLSEAGKAADPATPDQFTPQARQPEPNLLLVWPDSGWSSRWRMALVASLAIHVLFFTAGVQVTGLLPREPPSRRAVQNVTRLYLPPDLLTQKAPNKSPISKSFDLADVMAPQRAQRRLVAPPPGNIRRLAQPQTTDKQVKPRQPAPRISAEAPQPVDKPTPPPTGAPDAAIAPAPPPALPATAPTPIAGIEEPKARPAPRLIPPKTSVQDVVRSMAHDTSSARVVVSDEGQSRPLPVSPGQQSSPARMGSALELQTDPEGADFRPYLKRILAIVRRNWFSVLPDSARMGVLRGRTVVQFVVNRDGSVPKLVIADPSGLQPLDRAAVAGLSMSNPLPPLPDEFKGGFIRLQFSFNYNEPSN